MNKDRSILIVIDMIKGFTDIGLLSSVYVKNISNNIIKIIDKFKYKISIDDNHKENDIEFLRYPKHCLDGSEECEVCDELKNVSFTHKLYKNSTNGFFSVGFLQIIEFYIENNFDFYISGCCTDICIANFCITFRGYLDSINKNINIIVPKNLVETYDSEDHSRKLYNDLAISFMKSNGIIVIENIN